MLILVTATRKSRSEFDEGHLGQSIRQLAFDKHVISVVEAENSLGLPAVYNQVIDEHAASICPVRFSGCRRACRRMIALTDQQLNGGKRGAIQVMGHKFDWSRELAFQFFHPAFHLEIRRVVIGVAREIPLEFPFEEIDVGECQGCGDSVFALQAEIVHGHSPVVTNPYDRIVGQRMKPLNAAGNIVSSILECEGARIRNDPMRINQSLNFIRPKHPFGVRIPGGMGPLIGINQILLNAAETLLSAAHKNPIHDQGVGFVHGANDFIQRVVLVSEIDEFIVVDESQIFGFALVGMNTVVVDRDLGHVVVDLMHGNLVPECAA